MTESFFSPGAVKGQYQFQRVISRKFFAHVGVIDDGGIVFRQEDQGIGFHPDKLQTGQESKDQDQDRITMARACLLRNAAKAPATVAAWLKCCAYFPNLEQYGHPGAQRNIYRQGHQYADGREETHREREAYWTRQEMKPKAVVSAARKQAVVVS